MVPSDWHEIAALLLGCYAAGFFAGFLVAVYRRFIEQI